MKKTSAGVGWGWGLQREHDASFFFTPVLLFLLASHFSSLSAHVRVLAARDWYQPHVHDRRRLPAASRRQPLPLRQPGEPDEREAHDPEILGCVRLSYSFTRWLERAERRRLFQREIEGCEDGFTRTSRTSFFYLPYFYSVSDDTEKHDGGPPEEERYHVFCIRNFLGCRDRNKGTGSKSSI